MDRGEFAASLSEEQEEFIASRRDRLLKITNICIEEYKSNPTDKNLRRIEDNWLSASTLHFLLNKYPLWEYTELYKEYQDILENAQKDVAMAQRKKIMSKVLNKAGELLDTTWMFLMLGIGAGIGIFVLSQICKIMGV